MSAVRDGHVHIQDSPWELDDSIQCRTPLLCNRCGKKTVSKRIFLRFFEERNQPKKHDCSHKKFFPRSPVFHFFQPKISKHSLEPQWNWWTWVEFWGSPLCAEVALSHCIDWTRGEADAVPHLCCKVSVVIEDSGWGAPSSQQ